jgi:hypothetical protein
LPLAQAMPAFDYGGLAQAIHRPTHLGRATCQNNTFSEHVEFELEGNIRCDAMNDNIKIILRS